VGWIDLAQDSVASCCVQFDFMKGGEFLDQLTDYQLLKEDSAHVINFYLPTVNRTIYLLN